MISEEYEDDNRKGTFNLLSDQPIIRYVGRYLLNTLILIKMLNILLKKSLLIKKNNNLKIHRRRNAFQ